jgi:hypothetical protein
MEVFSKPSRMNSSMAASKIALHVWADFAVLAGIAGTSLIN